eukprot:1581522-Alexandrium_andersonii.AAC.1
MAPSGALVWLSSRRCSRRLGIRRRHGLFRGPLAGFRGRRVGTPTALIIPLAELETPPQFQH